MHARRHAAWRQRVLERADNTDASGFFNLPTGPELLDRAAALQPEHRARVFPPLTTLAMFLSQALLADGSGRQAINDTAVTQLIGGLDPHSAGTSGDCQARARLPLPMISTRVHPTGEIVTEGAGSWWLWQGRRVRLADGATMTLADTQEVVFKNCC